MARHMLHVGGEDVHAAGRITYRIQPLERCGAVVRPANPGNHRYTQAHITEDGRSLLRGARANLLESADEDFFNHLGDAQPGASTHVLRPLFAAQQAGRSTARPDPVTPRRGPGGSPSVKSIRAAMFTLWSVQLHS